MGFWKAVLERRLAEAIARLERAEQALRDAGLFAPTQPNPAVELRAAGIEQMEESGHGRKEE